MAEALNGTLKAELIDRCGPWKTRAQTEMRSTSGSPGHHACIHTSIGDVPPVEYELNHYSHITTPAPTGAR